MTGGLLEEKLSYSDYVGLKPVEDSAIPPTGLEPCKKKRKKVTTCVKYRSIGSVKSVKKILENVYTVQLISLLIQTFKREYNFSFLKICRTVRPSKYASFLRKFID
jgi:hypothetical protein